MPGDDVLHRRHASGPGKVRAAGELIMRYYQHSELAVEQKADASPVTAAAAQK